MMSYTIRHRHRTDYAASAPYARRIIGAILSDSRNGVSLPSDGDRATALMYEARAEGVALDAANDIEVSAA